MSDDLKLPQVGALTLPRWQYWLARYNGVLGERDRRIEKLEAALREIIEIHPFKDPEGDASVKAVVDLMFHINLTARRALKED